MHTNSQKNLSGRNVGYPIENKGCKDFYLFANALIREFADLRTYKRWRGSLFLSYLRLSLEKSHANSKSTFGLIKPDKHLLKVHSHFMELPN